MIETLITVLVLLLVAVIVWYVIKLIAAQFGVPDVWVHIVGLIIFLIFLLYALRVIGVRVP